jgi:CheY-like chemotaxis protein
VDGNEIARRVRAKGPEGILLVAITGYGTPEDHRRGMEAGFDHYLVKPIDHDALDDILASTADSGGPP